MKKIILTRRLNSLPACSGLLASLLLVLALIPQHLHAQETVMLVQNKARWEAYETRHLAEKMFVHTAKEIYTEGETIWLKIYSVDGFTHHLLPMSRVAYVELIDAGNQPVAQVKIGMRQGLGEGYLVLPVSLAPGTYSLRAYSNWMKNSGPAYFFTKQILVLNGAARLATMGSTQIHFFPEGGTILEEHEAVMGFAVKDALGHGVSCAGMILDNGRDSITSFTSDKHGNGKLSFIPQKGHSYKARLHFGNDSLISDLPAASAGGFMLHLEQAASGKYQLIIQTPATTTDTRYSYAYLLVNTRGQLKIARGTVVSNGRAMFEFDRTQIGDGVSQLQVMDKDFNPAGERLLFNDPSNRLVLTVATDKETYARREKLSLDISAAGNSGQPVAANLSVSVYKVDSAQPEPARRIDSYLLLQSDLESRVDDAASYFSGDGSPDLVALDNLMLTVTSERFGWKEVIGTDSAVFEPEVYGPIINGRMVSSLDGSPAQHINSYISVPGRNTNFRPAETDANGRIKFEMTRFTGNESVVFQTNTERDSNYTVTLQNPFSTTYASMNYPAYAPVPGDTGKLSDRQISARLAAIFDADSLSDAAALPDSGFFYGQADESYLLDNFTRFTTMEEVMREYIVSVNVFRKSHKLDVVLLDAPLKRFFENQPLVLVDGVPFFDIDAFMHLDPLKIKKIELVTRPYFLGSQEYDGIINCVTYHGDLDGIDLNRHARIIPYPGIQPAKNFHAKSYDTEAQQASRLPDFRDLLYWQSNLPVTATQKQTVHLFASDLPGKYAILVQGITTDGQPASRTIFVTVTR